MFLVTMASRKVSACVLMGWDASPSEASLSELARATAAWMHARLSGKHWDSEQHGRGSVVFVQE